MKFPLSQAGSLALIFSLAFLVAATSAQTIDLELGDVFPANTTIASGTTVNVNGGLIELGVELANGVLNINAGEVALGANSQGTGFNNINNTINMSGGDVGGFFQLRNGTILNMTGGVLESFGVLSNSSAIISGGTVLVFPDIVSGQVDISGGNVNSVRVFDDGTVNIIGTEFLIDNEFVDDIAVDETQEITQRNVTLSATLADGSSFGFTLTPQIIGFQPDAATFQSTVLITRVTAVLPGDLNEDGVVDLLDVAPFVEAILSGEFVAAADINTDGFVDLLDVGQFVDLILG